MVFLGFNNNFKQKTLNTEWKKSKSMLKVDLKYYYVTKNIKSRQDYHTVFEEIRKLKKT